MTQADAPSDSWLAFPAVMKWFSPLTGSSPANPSKVVLFLGKALLVGLAGGGIGYIVGYLVGTGYSGPIEQSLFDVNWLLTALLMAPALSAAATWLPALVAAGQDPAVVLQEQ